METNRASSCIVEGQWANRAGTVITSGQWSGVHKERVVRGGSVGIGGIDPKIAARNNPCDYAVIAVGLAEMMEEQENLETRRVIRHRSEVGVCVISNYAVIT